MLIEKWVVLELAVSLPRSDVRYLSNNLHTTLGCPPQFTSGWHTFIVTFCRWKWLTNLKQATDRCPHFPSAQATERAPQHSPQHSGARLGAAVDGAEPGTEPRAEPWRVVPAWVGSQVAQRRVGFGVGIGLR